MSNSSLISQSSSIAALRKAEKMAADKIVDARKRKQRRLKQAKEEAKLEIDAFKEEMEQRFQQHEQEESGSKNQYETYISEMLEFELDKLNQSVRENESKALDRLLESLLTIELSLHRNCR